MTTSNNTTPTPWAKSTAKRLLKADILSNKVHPLMNAKTVYAMHPEYAEYVYSNFRTNLRSLRLSIKKLQKRAASDEVALSMDLLLHGKDDSRVLQRKDGLPQWKESEACKLLKKDIDDGVNISLKPHDLWLSTAAYQAFPLKKFRSHLYQEIRRRKTNAYWSVKKFRGL